jgi:hypothetical protein
MSGWIGDGCETGDTLTRGWTPETGFSDQRWDNGYSEAHILYILALGSPTHPISEAGYQEWLSSFEWKKVYDVGYLYAGPLFIHQMSQLWLDFRGINDSTNTKYGIDYFESGACSLNKREDHDICTIVEGPGIFMDRGCELDL